MSASLNRPVENGVHVPRLDTSHRQVRFAESAVKPLRQWPGFQPNPLETVSTELPAVLRFARHLVFANDSAHGVHPALAAVERANANAMPFWQKNLDEPVAKNLIRDPLIESNGVR